MIMLSSILVLMVFSQVSGGSGNYSWQSHNTSLARVNALGLLTAGSEIGKTEITAADIRNPSLFDRATVRIGYSRVL